MNSNANSVGDARSGFTSPFDSQWRSSTDLCRCCSLTGEPTPRRKGSSSALAVEASHHDGQSPRLVLLRRRDWELSLWPRYVRACENHCLALPAQALGLALDLGRSSETRFFYGQKAAADCLGQRQAASYGSVKGLSCRVTAQRRIAPTVVCGQYFTHASSLLIIQDTQ